MKNKYACGEFPELLYRAFDTEKHAIEFLEKGKFRTKRVDHYSTIECIQRRDEEEETSCYRTVGKRQSVIFDLKNNTREWIEDIGEIESQGNYGGKVFALCCTLSNGADYARETFGKYLVKIDSPEELGDDIDKYLNSRGRRYIVCGKLIKYNKGELLDKVSDKEMADLPFSQKSRKFSEEKEFRYCMLSTGTEDLLGYHREKDIDEDLWINIGENKPYLSKAW